MSKIISIHSFRGGTGKSNTTANLAALIAAEGKRVGVVDTDIQSPGIHVLLGLEEEQMSHTLNDYLWGRCEIRAAAYDVTANLGVPVQGKLYLVPSSIKVSDIARILREHYDVGLLNDGFQRLIEDLQLDVLMVDTHPGLNDETLLSIAISDALVIVMRPDQQDFQGTSVTVEVARKLDVPRMMLVVNKTPTSFNAESVKRKVEQTYATQVGAVLPHSDEMMALASEGVFVTKYPDHAIAVQLRQVARALLAD
ncbi:MAG: MinD/ParA family protein [Anaerolineae bacterium]|nr:MinD/ParA family protein [Anaerolineae bacterium]MDW8299104.1 MinD/ParA family protein [Anaerolineae bacterium]